MHKVVMAERANLCWLFRCLLCLHLLIALCELAHGCVMVGHSQLIWSFFCVVKLSIVSL